MAESPRMPSFDARRATLDFERYAVYAYCQALAKDEAKRTLETDLFAKKTARDASHEAVALLTSLVPIEGSDELARKIGAAFEKGFLSISTDFKKMFDAGGKSFPKIVDKKLIEKASQHPDELTSAEIGILSALPEFEAFEKLREGVSERMWEFVREALASVGSSPEVVRDAHRGYAMKLAEAILGSAVSHDVFARVASMPSADIARALVDAKLIEPDDWFIGEFTAIEDGIGKSIDEAALRGSVIGLFLTNGAWRMAQVPRAIQTGSAKPISSDDSPNFGAYGSMSGAMYMLAQGKESLPERIRRICFETSRGREDLGVMRAVYEIVKDLNEARKAARLATERG